MTLIDADKGEPVTLVVWKSEYVAVVKDATGHQYIKTARGLTNEDGSEVKPPVDAHVASGRFAR